MLIDAEQRFDTAQFVSWVTGTAQRVPTWFCGITQDSRRVQPHNLYVALRGERFDGHDFVAQALERGAAAALVAHDWFPPPASAAWPLVRVAHTQHALAQAAQAWRARQRLPVVGITGSSGKTTTKEMLVALCSGAKVCATAGNLNNEIGLPLSLLKLDPQADYGVYEAGSNHPGEIARLAATMQPTAAIISSVGSAHIENFGSIAAIAREKGALLQAVPASGFVVVSREVSHYAALVALTKARLVEVSLEERTVDFFGEVVDVARGLVRVYERATGIRGELCSELPGRHNASNLLLAYAAARTLGVSAAAAVEGLRQLRLPAMRWQVFEYAGIKVINDAYNANPQSMRAALQTFMELPCRGRRIVVLGDMLELGTASEQLHRELGSYVAQSGPDYVVGVGEATCNYLLSEVRRGGLIANCIQGFKRVQEAETILRAIARDGDAILLKGSRGMMLERMVDGWQV